MNFFIKLTDKTRILYIKENLYHFVLIAIIFFLDRFSKLEIINNFSEKVYYINSFINFDLIWNTGIGFGLLNFDSILIYNLISVLIGIIITYLFFLMICSKGFDKLTYSIIIGGAVGNFYDRLFYKAVPDFVDLHLNNFHWFTFNLADVFISIGIILFLFRGNVVN